MDSRYRLAHNNIKIVRGDFTGYRWRFALIDLEWALNPNGWTDYTFDHINFMRNQYQPYIRFWQEMIKNTAYKAQFINRFADLMNTNYQFSVIGPMEQEMFDLTYPEMGGEFLRWAGTGSTEAQYLATYTSNHNIFINSLKYRTAEVRKHIVSNFALPKQVNVNLKVSSVEGGKIQISTIIPAQYPWTGVYFDGVPITITAIPNPGYEFESWDKNALITAVNQSSLTTVLTINNLTFKANFKLSDKPYPIVTISEINYKDEPSIPTSDWIELYNYGTAPALLKGWSVADENPLQRFTITDSIVLQPQQRLVIAKDTALFKQTNPQVESVVGNFDFGLGSNTDQVQLLNEKDSLIASFRYYNTFPWSVGADGRGRTLELKDVTKSLNDPANWFDGCIGGSPGAEYSVCREPIVLSEINFSSPATAETDDWIELWNTSDKPVDIGNWILKDDNDASIFRVPAPRVIAPDERLIVAQDIDKFAAINRETKNITGGFAFGFSSSSDWVRMYDAEGKLKISVRYNTTAPWPIFDGSNYYTLELLNENGNMQSANNWFAGCPQGSPGKAYNSNCELVGIDNTNQYDIDIKVFPQPAIDYVDIAFYLNEAVDNTTFTIYNLVGKEIQQIKLGKVESGYHLKHLNISELSANIYILAVRLGNNEKRIKLVKM